jgi:3-oxoacyl-[acyl-carrier-protein] synthase-3
MESLMNIPAGGSRCPATQESVREKKHFIRMQGREIFKIAVNVMAEAANKALRAAGLRCDDIDCLIPHQANIRILLAVAKKMGLPREKIYMNIDRYGNMSSASTATALYEAAKDGRIKKGDIVVLDAFGAGLVWGACVIKW